MCCSAAEVCVGEPVEDQRSLQEILDSVPPPPPPAMSSEPGAPRLMITHIVNRNFKSYAGEQILGPFHKVPPRSGLRISCACCPSARCEGGRTPLDKRSATSLKLQHTILYECTHSSCPRHIE